ncbi:EAL domain-containing protein [Methylonatrum kenyense]|uniref:bifunctional diguanylate cyclase/phosphodiesterase n=1 Tax=Methylonatrum kenyense TaxID=455253 RepID=UPI0020BF884C|nr:EAL domain-containing protein [Methylonatrum kenyense]MCK8516468.1 EAL domain-containing protein [Methylonatrum kenyense]
MADETSLLEAQQTVHELIAERTPLPQMLDSIANWIGILLPQATVAFMRYDADAHALSLIPSARFSQTYTQLLQQVPVGPFRSASFGAAAHDRHLVVTDDIATDPRWLPFREGAMAEGFRSCWSNPIVAPDGELLGTFGAYYASPALPTSAAKKRLKQASALIGLALVRDRDSQRHQEATEWHHSLFVNHPEGVYDLDLQGRFQRCNAALERITGYREIEIIGRYFNEIVDPRYREMTQRCFDAVCRGEAPTYETQCTHADGHSYILEVTKFPVTIEDKVVGVSGICRDVTERMRRNEELRILKRGIDTSPSGMLLVDAREPDMPIVYANPAFTQITGYAQQEILGRNCRFLQGPDSDPDVIQGIRRAIRAFHDASVVLLNNRKDGTTFWNHLTISPVFDDDGICTHFIGIQQDVTRQKEQEAHIAYQATHDLLTGLPNFSAFYDRVEEAMERFRQGAGAAAVLSLNLDGFKAINDELGHDIGNEVLAAVAQRLAPLAGPDDLVARLVGDEFAILLVSDVDQERVVRLAKRILATLGEPTEVAGSPIHLSASIGIACTRHSMSDDYELMQCADLALEQAKRQGRNTWQWYRSSRSEGIRESVAMRHDLHAALREEQFELHYQPVVDALSGRIRSVEALVRWHHPKRGVVSPGVFIPLAERTGQIVPLGRWVLHRACRDMMALNSRHGRTLPVAVNISSLQFGREGFLGDVQRTLEETGLSPRLLELEVTESVLIDGAEPVIDLMNALRRMGVKAAIDDFGTGFSSLSYLRDLPTHKVKLDQSFVAKALDDRRTSAIVQGVITMAHHMDMAVVAEGIETDEECNDMVRRQCDLLQGYLFSRPVPLGELAGLPDVLPVTQSAPVSRGRHPHGSRGMGHTHQDQSY